MKSVNYRKPSRRVAQYLSALPTDDPLVRSNALIDEANAAVDVGDHDRADLLFAEAEAVLDAEDALLDEAGVAR